MAKQGNLKSAAYNGDFNVTKSLGCGLEVGERIHKSLNSLKYLDSQGTGEGGGKFNSRTVEGVLIRRKGVGNP